MARYIDADEVLMKIVERQLFFNSFSDRDKLIKVGLDEASKIVYDVISYTSHQEIRNCNQCPHYLKEKG